MRKKEKKRLAISCSFRQRSSVAIEKKKRSFLKGQYIIIIVAETKDTRERERERERIDERERIEREN